MNAPHPVIGVLYAGEMGAALGTLLAGRGRRVVTTCAGRSRATADRCAKHRFEVLPSLQEVVGESNIVLSAVLPDAAESVASDYAAHAAGAPADAIFVDVNSIQPATVRQVEARIRSAGRVFVDAAVNGLARNAATTGTLFLSGRQATSIAALFDGAMRTEVLGDEPGDASAMKMLLGGVSKGVCALLTEIILAADAQGMLPAFSQSMQRIYPGIWQLIERMLPTYAAHAGRRSTEMSELAQTVDDSGIDAGVIRAVRRIHETLASVEMAPSAGQSVPNFIHHLRDAGAFDIDPSSTQTEARCL